MTVERADLDRAAELALATLSASDTPKWLADMAWETYRDMAWNLQWNDAASRTGEARSGLLLWGGAYWYQVEAFFDRLPDEIKVHYPADVIIARQAAKAADQHGHSTDFRLECCASLNRTLWRLIDHTEDAGTESIDSVLRESTAFLSHLARITANVSLPCEEDDDEIDDDTDDFIERGYNSNGNDYERIERATTR